jgi:uncharacterized protein YdcH (DUF465 family)
VFYITKEWENLLKMLNNPDTKFPEIFDQMEKCSKRFKPFETVTYIVFDQKVEITVQEEAMDVVIKDADDNIIATGRFGAEGLEKSILIL